MSATLHATCVAAHGRGALILGASGAGKSRLALEMIALGATLVADDRVIVEKGVARAPETLFGLIEARGLGLLRLPALAQAPVSVLIDLDARAEDRMPQPQADAIAGVSAPRHALAGHPFAAAAVMALLQAGGVAA